jgi:hypothetical protein
MEVTIQVHVVYFVSRLLQDPRRVSVLQELQPGVYLIKRTL